MDGLDRFFIASLSTLFLAVIFLEWRNRGRVPAHVEPPAKGTRLLAYTNVPDCRDGATSVNIIADMDAENATRGEWQEGDKYE